MHTQSSIQTLCPTIAMAISVEINRKPELLERLVSHSKQRAVPKINRKLSGTSAYRRKGFTGRESRVTDHGLSNREPKLLEPSLNPSKSIKMPDLIANFEPNSCATNVPQRPPIFSSTSSKSSISSTSSIPSPSAKLCATSMPARGKLIVLEGIDGSGKRTQLEMLASALAARGVEFSQVSFPRYDGFFGKLVARFLNGEFGSLEAVDPHFSALLYAGDRLEAKQEIETHLAAGRTVISDRYIASNLAHQGARVPRAKRAAFLAWLRELEYGIYALPREDLVIYLRVPAAAAHRLVAQKGARGYTKKKRDLQEADPAHLKAASEVYDELARQKNWVKIECVSGEMKRSLKSGPAIALRAPEEIHKEILAAVEARAFAALRANG
jgi:dTMP kinase